MANKIHCDICDKELKLKSVLEMACWAGKHYSLIERFTVWPPFSVLFSPTQNKKMDICEECFQDFKEFALRKKSYRRADSQD